MIIADVVIKSARLGSLLCPSASSVIPPACTWTHIHMRTLTTVTNSSQIDGRHSQDTDSLTSDFILYLPPALLTLLSRAKLWALVQGLQSVGRQAVRTTAQTFSVTAFTPPRYPIRESFHQQCVRVRQRSHVPQSCLSASERWGKSCCDLSGVPYLTAV